MSWGRHDNEASRSSAASADLEPGDDARAPHRLKVLVLHLQTSVRAPMHALGFRWEELVKPRHLPKPLAELVRSARSAGEGRLVLRLVAEPVAKAATEDATSEHRPTAARASRALQPFPASAQVAPGLREWDQLVNLLPVLTFRPLGLVAQPQAESIDAVADRSGLNPAARPGQNTKCADTQVATPTQPRQVDGMRLLDLVDQQTHAASATRAAPASGRGQLRGSPGSSGPSVRPHHLPLLGDRAFTADRGMRARL